MENKILEKEKMKSLVTDSHIIFNKNIYNEYHKH